MGARLVCLALGTGLGLFSSSLDGRRSASAPRSTALSRSSPRALRNRGNPKSDVPCSPALFSNAKPPLRSRHHISPWHPPSSRQPRVANSASIHPPPTASPLAKSNLWRAIVPQAPNLKRPPITTFIAIRHLSSLREGEPPSEPQPPGFFAMNRSYSTVTDLAKLRGWSTSQPRSTATWYAKSCRGIMANTGLSASRADGM